MHFSDSYRPSSARPTLLSTLAAASSTAPCLGRSSRIATLRQLVANDGNYAASGRALQQASAAPFVIPPPSSLRSGADRGTSSSSSYCRPATAAARGEQRWKTARPAAMKTTNGVVGSSETVESTPPVESPSSGVSAKCVPCTPPPLQEPVCAPSGSNIFLFQPPALLRGAVRPPIPRRQIDGQPALPARCDDEGVPSCCPGRGSVSANQQASHDSLKNCYASRQPQQLHCRGPSAAFCSASAQKVGDLRSPRNRRPSPYVEEEDIHQRQNEGIGSQHTQCQPLVGLPLERNPLLQSELRRVSTESLTLLATAVHEGLQQAVELADLLQTEDSREAAPSSTSQAAAGRRTVASSRLQDAPAALQALRGDLSRAIQILTRHSSHPNGALPLRQQSALLAFWTEAATWLCMWCVSTLRHQVSLVEKLPQKCPTSPIPPAAVSGEDSSSRIARKVIQCRTAISQTVACIPKMQQNEQRLQQLLGRAAAAAGPPSEEEGPAQQGRLSAGGARGKSTTATTATRGGEPPRQQLLLRHQVASSFFASFETWRASVDLLPLTSSSSSSPRGGGSGRPAVPSTSTDRRQDEDVSWFLPNGSSSNDRSHQSNQFGAPGSNEASTAANTAAEFEQDPQMERTATSNKQDRQHPLPQRPARPQQQHSWFQTAANGAASVTAAVKLLTQCVERDEGAWRRFEDSTKGEGTAVTVPWPDATLAALERLSELLPKNNTVDIDAEKAASGSSCMASSPLARGLVEMIRLCLLERSTASTGEEDLLSDGAVHRPHRYNNSGVRLPVYLKVLQRRWHPDRFLRLNHQLQQSTRECEQSFEANADALRLRVTTIAQQVNCLRGKLTPCN